MTGEESLNAPFPGFPNRFGFAPSELMRLLDHPCRPLWSILWIWGYWIWYIGYPGCQHLGSPYWGHQTGGRGLHHHRCWWIGHRGWVLYHFIQFGRARDTWRPCRNFGFNNLPKLPPVCATLIYHILVTAHKPDICTPATAHHPNFSHMLVLLLGSLEVYILY